MIMFIDTETTMLHPTVRARLYRIRVDTYGYEFRTKIFFGVGHPVYRFITTDHNETVSATSRSDAKRILKMKYSKIYPNLKFYN